MGTETAAIVSGTQTTPPVVPQPDFQTHLAGTEPNREPPAAANVPPKNGTVPNTPPADAHQLNGAATTAKPQPHIYQPATIIDKTRQQQIDDWVAKKSDASGGFLGIGQTSSAAHAYEALQGKSDLGGLSQNEQRYLVDKMVDKWGIGSNVSEFANLANKGDTNLKSVVSERLSLKASALMRQPAGNGSAADPHAQARAFAHHAITAAGGDKSALAQALGNLQPQDGALLAQALAETPTSMGFNSSARLAVLEALNSAPASPTTSAIVQNIFAGSAPLDAMRDPKYAHEMAAAVAREWFPDAASTAARDAATARLESIMQTRQGQSLLFAGPTDKRVAALATIRAHPEITAKTLTDFRGAPAENPAIVRGMAEQLTPLSIPNREATIDRVTGILGTRQGQTLFFGSWMGEDKVPAATRSMAQQAVLADPTITADTLRATGSPWENPAILTPLAQASAAQFRNDTPTTFSGKGLENMIGTSMGFRPSVPTNKSEQEIYAGITTGQLSLFTGKDGEAVDKVAAAIRGLGGDNPRVTVLPITYSNPEIGTVRLPLYRVQTADGEKYVDNIGRTYDSFEAWKNENKLPAGKMVFPENGHLTSDGRGGIKLASANTPDTVDTAGEVVGKILDYGALVGGVIAGGAFIIGTGGWGIVAIGIGAGAWGVYREGSELVDRYTHDQSINPFTDSEARSLWLGVAANATGIGAFASEAALMRFVSAETRLGRAAATTIGTGRVTATLTNAAAFTNSSVDLYQNWGQMTVDQRATALLQMGFWGVTSAMGARQARNFNELVNPVAAGRALYEGFNPPVERTSELPGNAVEMVRNPANGEWTIRAGMQATDADIALHVKMTRLTMMDRGLQGILQRTLGEPEPGTAAYKVKMESIKLHERVRQLEAKLADKNLTPQQRAQLEGDIAATQGHLNEVLQMSEAVIADPNVIAARSQGLHQAERFPGLVEALEQGPYAGKGYSFKATANPDEPPQIVRQGYDEEHPPLAAIRDNVTGRWTVGLADAATQQWAKSINEIRAFRQEHNLPAYQAQSGASGTVSLLEVAPGKKVFGLNTTLERNHMGTDNRALREGTLHDIQTQLNKLDGVKYGDTDAMFLTHGEAEALMKAHAQYGRLPEEMTLYVDRVPCNACQGAGSPDKGLSLLTELYGIKKLTIVDSYGNKYLIQPNQPTVKIN